ncbi:MAG: hypothetical protein II920_02665, partial [Clostridia bacterium]|nr:hypothetical protein [Clostridia bacterium]
MIFILHSDGLISVFNIASFLSAKGRAAGKKIGDVAGDVGHRVSDSIRIRAAERKQSEEKLFIDDIYKGDGEQGVEAYDLSKGSRRKTKVTQVNAVGDELVVPEVKPATNKTGKRAKSEDTEAYRRYESTPDILEELRNEDPKARNDKFMRDALSDHSAPRKPVLTFDYTPNSEKSARKTDAPQKTAEAKAYSFEKNDDIKPSAAKAETSPDRPKQPQQPKPSFFDKPVDDAGGNKTVRQNTEQGKPGDTTYVKPPMAKETEVSSGWQTVKCVQSPVMSAGKPQNALDKAQSEAPKARQAAEAPKPERVYYYPPMELMESGGYGNADRGIISADKDRERAEILVNKLKDFSIPVKLTGISHGPAVTRFEVLPAPNIKVSRVAAFADDIAMALEAESVRIEAPIPGKNAVGVEVPNIKKEVVHLRDVLESNEARRNNKRLMVGLGKDNAGKYIVADLGSMPHVLIAGQTGSGKSVCINAMIISILYRSNPDEVKMIMIDPKMVELAVYGTIPHLLVPVVTDPKKAAGALEWAVGEMQRRYKVFAEHNAKNIEYYNNHLPEGETKMPRIVIIIDELADLMMTSARDVEDAINRLAQLARAAGMHLVIATQRPSVNVITGLIKANIPTRIAFTVASGVDSRTILDSYGAEKLL